jgi:hypothetical protein
MGTRERDEALVRAGWDDPHVMKTIAKHIAEVDKVHPAPTEVSSERAERDVRIEAAAREYQAATEAEVFYDDVWLVAGDALRAALALPLASPVREMSVDVAAAIRAAVNHCFVSSRVDRPFDLAETTTHLLRLLSTPPRGPVAETGEASEKPMHFASGLYVGEVLRCTACGEAVAGEAPSPPCDCGAPLAVYSFSHVEDDRTEEGVER